MPVKLHKLMLSRMSIAQRLWLGLGLILGLFALADLASLWSASKVDTALRTLVSNAEARREATADMRSRLAAIAWAARQTTEKSDAGISVSLENATKGFEAALDQYTSLASSDLSRDLAQRTAIQYEAIKRHSQDLMRLVDRRRSALKEFGAHQRKLQGLVSSMPVPIVPARQSWPVQRLEPFKELVRTLAAAREDLDEILRTGVGKLQVQVVDDYARFNSALKRYLASAENAAERKWAASAAKWYSGVLRTSRMLTSIDAEQRRNLSQLDAARDQLDDLLAEDVQPAARAELAVAVGQASHAAHDANLDITRALLLALILGALAAVATMRAVRAPLTELVASTRRLADGQFSHRISWDGGDELGQLTAAFNRMAEKLQATTISHAYLGSIVDSIGEALFVVSRGGAVHTVNPAAAWLLGYHQSEFADLTFGHFLEDTSLVARIKKADMPLQLTAQLRHKSGITIPVSMSAVPLPNQIAGGPAVVCIARDLRERISVEQQQRQAEVVFDNTKEGIVLTDSGGSIVLVNPAFCEITRYDASEAEGTPVRLLWANRGSAGYIERVWESVRAQGQWQGEMWMRRKGGEVHPVWANISAVHDSDNSIANFVVVFSDISVIKEAEERLSHLAYHDALTNLPNRLLLADRLRLALDRAQRSAQGIALLFIDLDGFKHVNDTLGHDAGDRLLQEMARRLPTCTRSGDAIARSGGDEFVVVLEDINRPQQAARIAEQVLTAVSEPFQLGGIELRMSASIGISMSPLHGLTGDELLKAADAAMYRAKRDGGRTYQFFSSDLTKQAMEQLTLRNALRHPDLQGQLALHYQPQVELDTGRIVGVEALVRWVHPTHGVLMPGQFIPIAEEAGLVHIISEWVLKAACLQAKSWEEEGHPPVRVAVNVSPQETKSLALVERVRGALAQSGMDASLLELEVTEGALQSGDQVVEVLATLRDMGVRLALDDFGTGYSSLGSIRSLPFHRLKIDRSFVHDLEHDANARSITQAIIAMGRSLKLEILAEGVETLGQLRFLKDEGCDEVQGYLLARPMVAATFDLHFPDRTVQLPVPPRDQAATKRLSLVRATKEK